MTRVGTLQVSIRIRRTVLDAGTTVEIVGYDTEGNVSIMVPDSKLGIFMVQARHVVC